MRIDYKTILDKKALIREYYKTWEPHTLLPTKFRVIKFYGLVPVTVRGHQKWRYRWTNMHRFFNRRRLPEEMLPVIVQAYLEKKRVPLRVMQSALQFLEPQKIKSRKKTWSYLVDSSIVPFENDDGLGKSMQEALKVHDFLSSHYPGFNLLFVYSGNKSMHLWITNFKWKPFMAEHHALSYWYKPLIAESLENKARKKLLQEVLAYDPSIRIDAQSMLDTRRILPVISSLHGVTLRRVTVFTKREVETYTEDEIREQASLQTHHSQP